MVNDTKDNVTLSAGGAGFLQSRTFKGLPGSPANGWYGYEYRLDLRNAVGALNIACIDWMTISFGPVISTLDYNGDHKPDQVFRRDQRWLGNDWPCFGNSNRQQYQVHFQLASVRRRITGQRRYQLFLGPRFKTGPTEDRHRHAARNWRRHARGEGALAAIEVKERPAPWRRKPA